MANSGSEWRKWNLHVHTKGTNKNDQFSSATMDEFCHTFFKKAYEKQIHAIGITDYFSIERYQEVVMYRENIASKKDEFDLPLFSPIEILFINDIFIFPNLELRMLPATQKGQLINIHLLINPSYVPHLEHDFLTKISNDKGHDMTRSGLTNYGKSLISDNVLDHVLYEKGVNNYVIDIISLKKILNNDRLKDNTILVVSNSKSDGASGLQEHYSLFENEPGSLDGLRQSIYKLSHAIFSSNAKDIKYFLGKKSEGQAGYSEETHKAEVREVIESKGSLKACLVGCDAHKESDLFSRFTWIKADLNFEGLRQICYEPEQRVKIQESKPDFKEDKLVIDQVRFISGNTIFPVDPIYFNPNLNVIIGGKSSGKSILLYTIAKTLCTDDSVLKNDDGTFKYDLDKLKEGLNFEVTTKGGFKQNCLRNGENSILPEIKYIPQNYLVKLAEPELNKKGRSLNQLVRDLILEDIESNAIYNEFVNTVKKNDILRNAEIDLFFQLKNEIAQLEGLLKTKSNVNVLSRNIETNSNKVAELTKVSGFNDAEAFEYRRITTSYEESNNNIQSFRDDFAALKAFNSEVQQVINNLKQKKDTVLNTLKLKEIRDYGQDYYRTIDLLVARIEAISSSLDVEVNSEGKRFIKNSSVIKELFSRLNQEKNTIKLHLDPYLERDKMRVEIEALNLSILNDRKALNDINDLNNTITEKKKLLGACKEKLFSIYNNSYQQYQNIITELKERTAKLEVDSLSIQGMVRFNFPKLRNEIYEISDGRSASYKNYTILDEDKKGTDNYIYVEFIKEIKNLFNDLIESKYILKNKIPIINAVKMALDDFFFDDWIINYKGDRLGEMSSGKASFVILLLIIGLSRSKAPILIDQPEDNLDNRSITTDLINYLRLKKLDRQIIIVTHNANIVVNADAENIIVANQKGQNNDHTSSTYKFDYINGSLENSFEKLPKEKNILKSMGIRQHIADIVEGGKDAFMMREKKYRFK